MGLVTNVLAFCIVFVIFTIILTVQYTLKQELDTNNIYMFKTANDIKAGIIIVWSFAIVTICLLFMDIHLVLLHLWLIKHNLTTYEYIMAKNKKQDGNSQVKPTFNVNYTIKYRKTQEKMINIIKQFKIHVLILFFVWMKKRKINHKN